MPEPAPYRKPAPLWRNVGFTLMWTSSAASGFGDRMMMLAALALLGGLGQQVESSSVLAATQVFFLLPYLIFSLPGGWLSDRLPRKWILLSCDEARGLLLLGSLLLVGAQATASTAAIAPSYHWQVFLALFLVGTAASIFNPARNAIVPQIVPIKQLGPANSIILGITVIASIIGSVVGGQIIDPDQAFSVRQGLLVGAGLYLVSGTFFAFLKPTRRPEVAVASPAPSTQPRRRRSMLDALRYTLTHRRVMILIALNLLVWTGATLVYAALIAITKLNFGYDKMPDSGNLILERWTLMGGGLGLGMLGGAGVVAAYGHRRELGPLMMLGLIGAGLFATLLAILPIYWLAVAAAFGLGLCGYITIIGVVTLLQSICPDYMRGRIMGLNSMINTSTAVAVNVIIWQLPNINRLIAYVDELIFGPPRFLGRHHLQLPPADELMLWLTFCVGPLLSLVGLYGLYRTLTRGPLRDRISNTIWHILRLYTLAWHRVRWIDSHHVPATGPALMALNHTTGLDTLVVQSALRRRVRWLMTTPYMVPFLNFMWRRCEPIALDPGGSNTAKIRSIVQALDDGDPVGIFPEGILGRKDRTLKPLQPGIVMVAKRSNAPITPVWIAGSPRAHHMAWHFLLPSRTTVRFGKPYHIAQETGTKEALEDLRQRLETLKQASEQDAPSQLPSKS